MAELHDILLVAIVALVTIALLLTLMRKTGRRNEA